MRIVRITAMWCMSCLVMKKVWKQVLTEYQDIEIIDLDFDFDKDKVSKYDVGKTLPVLILYKDDQEISRIIGEKSRKEMAHLIKEFYEKDI